MKTKPSPEHIEAFTQHAIAALPADFNSRREVLVTLLYLLPRDYPRRREVAILLESLRAHERAQSKFSFPPAHPDGHDGNGGKS